MTATQSDTSANGSVRARIEALEGVLSAQLQDYRALLACIEQKGEAVRHAQMDRIADIFRQEAAIVERIGQTERTRTDMIRGVSQAIRPGAERALRVSEIAQAQPDENARARLLAIAEQLRSVATEVRERSSRVRAAADALARHMSGVMQSVRSALSRAGVYENKGRLAVGAQLDFSVDVRS